MTNLLRLLQLADPALPIGGFSHSAGLETYVQHGIVKDKHSAAAFVEAQLSQNLLYTDAAYLSLAYDAAIQNDLTALLSLDEDCNAVKLPREIREASRKLGLRLLKIFAPIHSHSIVEKFRSAVATNTAAGHYCVAFGLLACIMQIEKQAALQGFFYNAAASAITNCVKLIPLGQGEGQAILFSLHDLIETLAGTALLPDREKIGLCCSGFDIRSMQHERLYSRLYMS